jgi:hypothetical protein
MVVEIVGEFQAFFSLRSCFPAELVGERLGEWRRKT